MHLKFKTHSVAVPRGRRAKLPRACRASSLGRTVRRLLQAALKSQVGQSAAHREMNLPSKIFPFRVQLCLFSSSDTPYFSVSKKPHCGLITGQPLPETQFNPKVATTSRCKAFECAAPQRACRAAPLGRIIQSGGLRLSQDVMCRCKAFEEAAPRRVCRAASPGRAPAAC